MMVVVLIRLMPCHHPVMITGSLDKLKLIKTYIVHSNSKGSKGLIRILLIMIGNRGSLIGKRKNSYIRISLIQGLIGNKKGGKMLVKSNTYRKIEGFWMRRSIYLGK